MTAGSNVATLNAKAEAAWQRAMAHAIANGVVKERFTDHDIRRKREAMPNSITPCSCSGTPMQV